MVVVRCLILCCKFAKTGLSAELRPDTLGELTALPQIPYSWIMGKGREREDGKAEGGGEEGIGNRGQEEGKEA